MVKYEDVEDICGLCGKPGADKIPHPMYWPRERKPGTPYVHAECERAESERAMEAMTEAERREYLGF